MTKSFLLSFFLLLSLVIFSQQGDGGLPKTFKEVIGTDSYLDEAITYYLDLDNVDDDEEEWDE